MKGKLTIVINVLQVSDGYRQSFCIEADAIVVWNEKYLIRTPFCATSHPARKG